MRVVAAVNLVVMAATCAGIESFLAPNPRAPDAVPYGRSLDARPPHRGDAEATGLDERDVDGAVEPKSPSQPAKADDDSAVERDDR
jgi:hypothetical protein